MHVGATADHVNRALRQNEALLESVLNEPVRGNRQAAGEAKLGQALLDEIGMTLGLTQVVAEQRPVGAAFGDRQVSIQC